MRPAVNFGGRVEWVNRRWPTADDAYRVPAMRDCGYFRACLALGKPDAASYDDQGKESAGPAGWAKLTFVWPAIRSFGNSESRQIIRATDMKRVQSFMEEAAERETSKQPLAVIPTEGPTFPG